MTDILVQRESTGIHYEPYANEFKQCIFEEPGVQGRNERYEFRCDAALECCGRVCCIPTAGIMIMGIPLWLFLLFLALGLLLLLALLYLLYRLCKRYCMKKAVEKKEPAIYRSIHHADDDAFWRNRNRGEYDQLPNGHGYSNRSLAVNEPTFLRPSNSFHEEETFEEEFKEEIEIGAGERRDSYSSEESVIERRPTRPNV